MNRRPKLSLVSNRELNKKQALDFETTKQTGTRQTSEFEIKPPESTKAVHPKKPPSQGSNRRDDWPSGWGWPNAKLLAKAAIVVVTVALSVYLVKRRLL